MSKSEHKVLLEASGDQILLFSCGLATFQCFEQHTEPFALLN